MPSKWVCLFIGALLGNLEGVCLLGFLREKKKYIGVPFLDPENIKIL
jgi:presenilin-like A22 family membrane protease